MSENIKSVRTQNWHKKWDVSNNVRSDRLNIALAQTNNEVIVNHNNDFDLIWVGIMTIAKKRLTWYTKRTYTNKTKWQYHTIKQEATFLNMKLYNICYTYSTNWRSFGWKVNKRTPMVSGTKLLVFLHKGPKVHIPI